MPDSSRCSERGETSEALSIAARREDNCHGPCCANVKVYQTSTQRVPDVDEWGT